MRLFTAGLTGYKVVALFLSLSLSHSALKALRLLHCTIGFSQLMCISYNTHVELKWGKKKKKNRRRPGRRTNVFFPVQQQAREKGQRDGQFNREVYMGRACNAARVPAHLPLGSLSCTCTAPVNTMYVLTAWTNTQTHTLHSGDGRADTLKSYMHTCNARTQGRTCTELT